MSNTTTLCRLLTSHPCLSTCPIRRSILGLSWLRGPLYGDVTLDIGVFVLFGVVIRAELDRVEVGAQTNIQDNSVLHCDEDVPCVLGRRVTVGHAAVVHGALVGDRCLIGIGAKLLNRSRLAEGAWLASGSVLAEGKEMTALDSGDGHPGQAGAGAD